MILWKIPCSIQSRLLGFVPVWNCLDAWGGYKFLVIYVGLTAVTYEKKHLPRTWIMWIHPLTVLDLV